MCVLILQPPVIQLCLSSSTWPCQSAILSQCPSVIVNFCLSLSWFIFRSFQFILVPWNSPESLLSPYYCLFFFCLSVLLPFCLFVFLSFCPSVLVRHSSSLVHLRSSWFIGGGPSSSRVIFCLCRVFWGETDIFVRGKRHPFGFCSDLIGAEGLGKPKKMHCQHLLP